MILPIIIAGGSGERLWPLSRALKPKQFLCLNSNNSLLQDSLLRIPQNNPLFLPALIVCQEEHRFLVAEQLRQKNISTGGIILEPMLKNTALAIAVAVLWAQKHWQDLTLLVVPADHVISEPDKFHTAIENAYTLAQQDYIVTFGVTPTYAETGYGYIKKGPAIDATNGFSINEFIEKPNLAKAQELLTTNSTLWNSGMFMFKSTSFLTELVKYQEKTLTAAKNAIEQAKKDLDFIRLDKKSYSLAPSISIDHAIMEHTKKSAVVALAASWCDIGSWHSLWKHSNKDSNNNVVFGEPISIDTNDCFIDAREIFIATIGVKNLIISATKDAILIADQQQAQQVKDIVQTLKIKNPDITNQPYKVARPWGWFASLAQGDNFQVKRIVIDEGKSISLQLHHHRSEHWIVVKGMACITRGEEVFLLTENQSTYIPLGTKHRLENIGKIQLEIIEIQSGSYLGEDDIVRYKDEYGRANVIGQAHE